MDKITIAIVTGSIGLITAVITSFLAFLQSKRLEKLKSELDIRQEKDREIFKFFLTFETNQLNQSFIELRDFIKLTQFLKDQLRDLIKNREEYFENEFNENLESFKDDIIKQYSKSAYYFNKADQDRNAHTIKNLFVQTLDLLKSNSNIDRAYENLKNISAKQDLLQTKMEIELKKLMPKLIEE